ncbi:serine hydroxymethyltransferase [Candidatus Woesearchaeota archaeon]|nr:serine hydroxymethyltransferase [Candidatus Woesearchaeota archaeon]
MNFLQKEDSEIYNSMKKELARQQTTLQMIPSENYASSAVLEACGSILNNKYSEGYPKKRYYQGNEFIDEVEITALERAKKLFGAEHVNVQPLSGSPANQAVFFSFLSPGDKFMGLDLSCGGHLTHGNPYNFSGKLFKAVSYGVNKDTELLDYNEIRILALKEKPKLIISGFTAYPRLVDFKKFQEIAEEVGAIHLADISHIAGLVVAGVHYSPFPFTDIVTTTTHKTLRGPRSAIIMCKEKYAKEIDRAVFPGLQGGPHEHIIAAKAVCFKEALTSDFKVYAQQIVKNAKALAETLMESDIKLVTNGTDNHLILIDLRPQGIGLGKPAAMALEEAGICTNCNTVPYDPSPPFKPSGVRIGTPALTTRGMKETEMKQIGEWIAKVLKNMNDTSVKQKIREEIRQLCAQFPIYKEI